MNTEQKSFTGRKRERKTRPSVHIANGIAKYVITLGGIGTILSVLLVAFFLIYVVIPLFMPPSLPHDKQYTFDDLYGGARLLMLDVDDYTEMSYIILSDGTLVTYNLADGQIISRQNLFAESAEEIAEETVDRGGNGDSPVDLPPPTVEDPRRVEEAAERVDPDAKPRITAFASAVNADNVVFGFSNGTSRLGTISFEVSYLEPHEVPEELHDIETGVSVAYQDGVVSKTQLNQFRYQEISLKLEEPLTISETGSPIILTDFSNTPSAESVISLTANGQLVYSRVSRKTNMLTGEETLKATNGAITIPGAIEGRIPRFIKLTGLGEFIYLVWQDGTMRRYNSRDINNMALMEELDLTDEPGETVSALEFLIGKRSLVVGTSSGDVDVWFPTRPEGVTTGDGFSLTKAHDLVGSNAEVTSLAYSERSRKMAAGFADGSVRLYYATNNELLAEGQLAETMDPIKSLVISPKEDYLVALSDNRHSMWEINAPHPETTLGAMFLPVWYEGYDDPAHVWQTSSASSDFEPKYGMMPLIFGTFKATFYSLLFGVPLALLAAIYTSEFLNPKLKSAFKPTIEMMASLPSVVLGFIAGLVIAPYIEDFVPEVLAGVFTVPVTILIGAYLWQLIPPGLMVRAQKFRLFGVVLSLPVGFWLAGLLGRPVEKWLFSGNIKAWLADHSIGSGLGGWMLLMVPLSALLVFLLSGYLAPMIRRWTMGWSTSKYAVFGISKFFVILLLTLSIALLVSWLLTSFGFDPRGSYIDTYVQRNAMIVGFIMGFAIIPIIYTIAEDALSAVPSHLRAGSLGAGATPWQTAVRIIIPTAMSGLFSAIMIGLGRAVGETMIVLMAAGNTPVMEMNMFNGFRTLSANIAVELPEAVRNSTHYRSLFLAALVLFILTFIINTLAEVVRQRFRKRSSQL